MDMFKNFFSALTHEIQFQSLIDIFLYLYTEMGNGKNWIHDHQSKVNAVSLSGI
jgi:hypothetical protein